MAVPPFSRRVPTEPPGRSLRFGLRGLWSAQPPGEPARPSAPPAPRLPRALTDGYAQLRRDVGMVLRGLRGEHPPPLVPLLARAPSQRAISAQRGVMDQARSLVVAEVRQETPEAISVLLRDPQSRPLPFIPGQFLTLLLEVQGESLRRAYSIASSPSQRDTVRVAVKRVPGGRASNFLCDQLRAGQTLRVLGPSGQFTCAPMPEAARHVVLLGGGSGITPLMSIAQAVLELEPHSRVSLIYGNRAPRHVMFRDALERLAAREPERFTLRHVFSEPPPDYVGAVGLLDAPTASAQLDALGDDPRPASYYVCGPAPMMAACRKALLERGVDAASIHEESFLLQAEMQAPPSEDEQAQGQDVRVDIAGQSHRLRVAAGQTLLEAGLAAGLAMPFSCAMGGCGACRVKLHDGKMSWEEPNCLTPDERKAGYVLACASRPRTACRIEVA